MLCWPEGHCLAHLLPLPGMSMGPVEGAVAARGAGIAVGMVCCVVSYILGRFLRALVVFAVKSD